MFVLAGFFCDGRPQIQSRADDQWAPLMVKTCSDWVKARRRHTSILIWRPTDVPPPRLQQPKEFLDALAAEVKKLDPRPIADGSDVVGWGQPAEDPKTHELNYMDRLEAAGQASQPKPFLCKEIYGGFQDVPKLTQFFDRFYARSFELGSTGMLVQHLPLIVGRPDMFNITWPSDTGPGNRDTVARGTRSELPNWCDSNDPTLQPTPYARQFPELLKKYEHVELKPKVGVEIGDVLVNGLPPDSFVTLTPTDDREEPRGMLSGRDGKAWFAGVPAGKWRIVTDKDSKEIEVTNNPAGASIGYDYLQHVDK
jgi:hypothetical protein